MLPVVVGYDQIASSGDKGSKADVRVRQAGDDRARFVCGIVLIACGGL